MDGKMVDAAVIQVWSANEIKAPVAHDQLNPSDLWWTASLDAVILNGDRDGNWGTAPDGKTPRLFDHGNAFEGGVGSTFYALKKDEAIPAEIRAGLERLRDDAESAGLKDLLPSGEFDSMLDRVRQFLSAGKLNLQ